MRVVGSEKTDEPSLWTQEIVVKRAGMKIRQGIDDRRAPFLALIFVGLLFLSLLGASYLYNSRTPHIAAREQYLTGTRLVVNEVTAVHDGFVVAHPIDEKGNPVLGKSLGYTSVKKGMTTDVAIDVGEILMSGTRLVVVLHSDTGTIGKYEYAATPTDKDRPVMRSGKPVAALITIR